MKNNEAIDTAENSKNGDKCDGGVMITKASGNPPLHLLNRPLQESAAVDSNNRADCGSRQFIEYPIHKNLVEKGIERNKSKTNEPSMAEKVRKSQQQTPGYFVPRLKSQKLQKLSEIITTSTSTATASAQSAPTAKQDVDTAASILVDLTLASTQSNGNTYPIGTQTKKYFPESKGGFQGRIYSYNRETKLYSVEYDGNNTEELEHDEINTEPLPPYKYDIGTQYEALIWSKMSEKKMGSVIGTIKSKFYQDPNHLTPGKRPRSRRQWRYTVVYSDGESEDVMEPTITRYINKAQREKDRQKVESTEDQMDIDVEEEPTVESSSEEEEESDEDSSTSSSETEEDPNPEQIPYWTGKQHHQFISGLRKYGLGNLEDIHEANCIPSRSFQELVRYWHWYVSDMEEKGLILNYEAKGTVNGKKGRPIGTDNNTSVEEQKEEPDKNPNVEPKKESKVVLNSEGFHAGKWTDQEVEMLAEALVSHGSSYRSMSDFMKIRSPEQISSYYNKNKKKVQGLTQKYARQAQTIVPADNKADSKVLAPAEHDVLVEALAIYGHDYQKVASYLKCRTAKQIQAYVKRKPKAIDKQVEEKKRLLKKKFPKKTHAWTCSELSRLVEGHALFKNDFEQIARYVKTRSEEQVQSILETNPSQYKDESAFDLGGRFAFAIELYHVLNIAPFEGFCHIISWSDKGDFVIIHDKDKFSNVVFPRFSHRGTKVEAFYKNLEVFGFQNQTTKKGKGKPGTYHHPSFQKDDYRKVEQFCRKAFA